MKDPRDWSLPNLPDFDLDDRPRRTDLPDTPDISEHTQRRLRRGAGLAVIAGTALGAFYLTWQIAGPIDAIAYAFFLLVGALWLPTTILLGAPSFPRSFRALFGKGQWILAAVAYDVPFLVQRRTKWELCPGRETSQGHEVYVDDEWHPIEAGEENMTVLGWRPFGILRYKDDRTFLDERADTKADRIRGDSRASATDGGTTVERGGYTEGSPPPVSGVDGRWLIDLKRVYSRGIKRIGDIDIIEKAEEVTRRKEAGSSPMDGWQPIIGSLVGLVLGVATGYVLLGGV